MDNRSNIRPKPELELKSDDVEDIKMTDTSKRVSKWNELMEYDRVQRVRNNRARVLVACYFRRKMDVYSRSVMLYNLTGQKMYRCVGQFHWCVNCGEICSPFGKHQLRFRVCVGCIKMKVDDICSVPIYEYGSKVLAIQTTLINEFCALEARVMNRIMETRRYAEFTIPRWNRFPHHKIDYFQIIKNDVDRELINRFFVKQLCSDLVGDIIYMLTGQKDRSFINAIYCNCCDQLLAPDSFHYRYDKGKQDYVRYTFPVGNTCVWCIRMRSSYCEKLDVDVSVNHTNKKAHPHEDVLHYDYLSKRTNDWLTCDYLKQLHVYVAYSTAIVLEIQSYDCQHSKFLNEIWLNRIEKARNECLPLPSPEKRSKPFCRRFPKYNKPLWRHVVKQRRNNVRLIDVIKYRNKGLKEPLAFDQFKLLTFLCNGDRRMAKWIALNDTIDFSNGKFANTIIKN